MADRMRVTSLMPAKITAAGELVQEGSGGSRAACQLCRETAEKVLRPLPELVQSTVLLCRVHPNLLVDLIFPEPRRVLLSAVDIEHERTKVPVEWDLY